MEWYFGNEVEDDVVPKNYERAQMISSPESWAQWGMTGEELTFNRGKNLHTSFDSNNKTSKSNNSSMTRELYNNGGSLLSNDEAGYLQFAEEEARISHMDDIYFSSLLEEDNPTRDSTGPHDNTSLGNYADIFEGGMVNSQYVGSHGQNFACSKHFKTHAFSPSTDWGNGEVSTIYQMPKQYTTSNQNMEESVLNDLERVTAQFTEKTRICFRDAFYRLAENSKQLLNSCQDESMMTCIDDTMRSGGTESKTNVIDRAVASLVYHNNSNDYYDDDDDDDAQHKLAQPTAYY